MVELLHRSEESLWHDMLSTTAMLIFTVELISTYLILSLSLAWDLKETVCIATFLGLESR